MIDLAARSCGSSASSSELGEMRRARRRQGLAAVRAFSPAARARVARWSIAASLALVAAPLHADADRDDTASGSGPPASPSAEAPDPEKSRQMLRRITEPGTYFGVFGTVMAGAGIRFNNPYRLTRVLGDTAQSLSLTSPYVDFGFGMVTGSPTGLAHGVRLGWSIAVSGVPQTAVTPAYLAAWRPAGHWLLCGWLGIPVLTAPDLNAGGELAFSGTYFVRAGLGATAALVADGFYGAGTPETRGAFYPVLSAQLGVSVNDEVLP